MTLLPASGGGGSGGDDDDGILGWRAAATCRWGRGGGGLDQDDRIVTNNDFIMDHFGTVR